MDAFNVAFRVPNLLRDLFAEGAMSAAFVPAFTRRLAAGGARRAPGGSATSSSTRSPLVTLACVVGGWFFAPALVARARAGVRGWCPASSS